MGLNDYSFDQLLPGYLTNVEKGRIRDSLEQFFDRPEKINYNGFYSMEGQNFLMQSDILHSVSGIDWNEEQNTYTTGYSPALLISNSCDVSTENNRSINSKEALFAPLISVKLHLQSLHEAGYRADQIQRFHTTLAKQEYTNLLYLPPNPINHEEYIVRLDRIYWVPQTQLVNIVNDLNGHRFVSLSDWGYYLYLTKLSLHTCRVPEEIERRNPHK